MGGLLILVVATVGVPGRLEVQGAGADGAVRDARLRRDRLPRRLHQADAPPFARLAGRWKLLLLALITVGVVFAADHQQLPTNVFIPVVHWNVELSYGWYVLLFLVIAGTANGVNLTDGLDGLAAGTGIIAMITFTAISVVTYIRSGNPARRLTAASTSRSSAPR